MGEGQQAAKQADGMTTSQKTLVSTRCRDNIGKLRTSQFGQVQQQCKNHLTGREAAFELFRMHCRLSIEGSLKHTSDPA
jgi:hypothetical protein